MNPLIGQVLQPEYNWVGVGFSYLSAFLGSMLALLCARRIVRADGSRDWTMLASAAVALGGIGIWAMHFIGMSAYRLPIAIGYSVPLTALSLAAAVLISGIALYLAGGRRFNTGGWIAGSLLAGVGVCVMHYMGMYAMSMRAEMKFDLSLIALSVVIAIAAAGAALWLAFNLNRLLLQMIAAVVMAIAVCAMHYVGMAAAGMVCTAPAPPSGFTIGGTSLGLVVFGVAGTVLIMLMWIVTGRMLSASPGRSAGA